MLSGWLGTVYLHGQSCKGTGADCIGFVAGVMDELYGIDVAKDRPKIDSTTISNLILFCRRNWPSECLSIYEGFDILVEPGDVLLVSGAHGTGHIMLVGPKPNTLWHCSQGPGVAVAGMTGFELISVYHTKEKHRWQLKSGF